eukprot:COSAG05_NODE_294_length_11993_cov_75.643181_3_plen_79_part_00
MPASMVKQIQLAKTQSNWSISSILCFWIRINLTLILLLGRLRAVCRRLAYTYTLCSSYQYTFEQGEGEADMFGGGDDY